LLGVAYAVSGQLDRVHADVARERGRPPVERGGGAAGIRQAEELHMNIATLVNKAKAFCR
jgi:hypothetical protein